MYAIWVGLLVLLSTFMDTATDDPIITPYLIDPRKKRRYWRRYGSQYPTSVKDGPDEYKDKVFRSLQNILVTIDKSRSFF